MRITRVLSGSIRRTPWQTPRRYFSNSCTRCRTFEEGDIVLLRDRKNASHEGTLVRLQASRFTHTHRGLIEHSDIIGKEPRQLVQSSKGASYRIFEPTLAEYVRLTPRLVTPIYPSDTNLIVSLLDIHVDTPGSFADSGPPLEILEAGTGHGALTLHLARAIHAANPPLPRSPRYTTSEEVDDPVYLGESVADLQDANLVAWKEGRRAVVHTLDISSKHSKHAEKIVQGFRRGMYSGNVDFHVGDVSAWIARQRESRKTTDAFLTYVFLDLPNADSHLTNVASVLHVDGILAVFNPSITQIVDCVEAIRKHKMPYLLDQVIELGVGTIREWDIRAVRPRAAVRKAEEQEYPETLIGEEPIDPVNGQEARGDELASDLAKQGDKWAIVCRPKAGQQVVGGGFLGLWRRMEPSAVTSEA